MEPVSPRDGPGPSLGRSAPLCRRDRPRGTLRRGAAFSDQDLIVAAQQTMTREWWRDAPERFVLVASELVFTEAGAGDTDAARARLTALEMATSLNTTKDAAAMTRKAAGTRGVSARGCRGCGTRRRCRHEPGRLSADVASPSHRECRRAASDRASVSERWLRAAGPPRLSDTSLVRMTDWSALEWIAACGKSR